MSNTDLEDGVSFSEPTITASETTDLPFDTQSDVVRFAAANQINLQTLLSEWQQTTTPTTDTHYDYYIWLYERFAINDDGILDRRIAAFYSTAYITPTNYMSMNKIKFLIYGEKVRACLPIGRPWELSVQVVDMYTISQKLVDSAFKQLIELKRQYEMSTSNSAAAVANNALTFDQPLKYVFSKPEVIDTTWTSAFQQTMSREVEIRLQDITGTSFGKVFNYFMHSRNNFFFNNIVNEVRMYSNNIRSTHYDEKLFKPHIQFKKELSSYINPKYKFKVSVAEEQHVDSIVGLHRIGTRKKNTFRFYTPHENNLFYNLEVSLSIVINEYPNKPAYKTYEVEVERKFGDYQHWAKHKPTLIQAIKTLLHIVHGDVLVDTQERQAIRSTLSVLFTKPYMKDILAKVLPLTKTKECLLTLASQPIWTSLKYDGERHVLFCKAKLGTFLIGLDDTITRVGPYFSGQGDLTLILDCEVVHLTKPTSDSVDTMIAVFDVRYDNRRPMEHVTFSRRYAYLRKLIDTLPTVYNRYTIEIKTFKLMENISDVRQYMGTLNGLDAQMDPHKSESTRAGLRYDGIIFQPDVPYVTRVNTYKWKPQYMNTLDFAIPFNVKPSNMTVHPVLSDGQELTNINIVNAVLTLGYHKTFSMANLIVECFYHPHRDVWIPCRLRLAKSKPNAPRVVASNLRLITDSFSLKNMLGFQLLFSTKLSNEVKRRILSKHMGSLLDIGSGQGADIDKWGHFEKVICYEPSVSQCMEFTNRLETSPNKGKITLYPTLFDKQAAASLINLSKRADIIAMFFSVNYIFESEKNTLSMLEALHRVATHSQLSQPENLRAQGVPIIIMYHEGRDVVSTLMNTHPSVFDIQYIDEKAGKIKTTIVGSEYVKGIEEYLFYTDIFSRHAVKFFDIRLNTITDVLPEIKLEVLSEPDQLWLRSIRIMTLYCRSHKNDHTDDICIYYSPEDLVDEIEAEDTSGGVDVDMEAVERDYGSDVDEIEVVVDEDIFDNANVFDDDEQDETTSEKPINIFPPLVTLSSNQMSIVQVDTTMAQQRWNEIKLQNKYWSSYVKQLGATYPIVADPKSFVICEVFIRMGFQNNLVVSNLPAVVFTAENLIPGTIRYSVATATGPKIANLEFLMYNNAFTTVEQAIELEPQWLIYVQYVNDQTTPVRTSAKFHVLIVETLTPEVLDIVNSYENVAMMVTLSYPCIVFGCSGSQTSNNFTADIVSTLVQMDDIPSVNAVLRLYRKNIFLKDPKHMTLSAPTRGILWDEQSCYADVVIMCMGASTMAHRYFDILSRASTPIAKRLLLLLVQVYQNKNNIRTTDLLTTVGFTPNEQNDSSEFLEKLSDNIPELKYKIKYTDGREELTPFVLKYDFDSLKITSVEGTLLVVLNTGVEAVIGDLSAEKVAKLKKETQQHGEVNSKIARKWYEFELQAIVYAIPAHYICVFRRFDLWYLYDGLEGKPIQRLGKKFVISEYKGKPIVPFLMFYRRIFI